MTFLNIGKQFIIYDYFFNMSKNTYCNQSRWPTRTHTEALGSWFRWGSNGDCDRLHLGGGAFIRNIHTQKYHTQKPRKAKINNLTACARPILKQTRFADRFQSTLGSLDCKNRPFECTQMCSEQTQFGWAYFVKRIFCNPCGVSGARKFGTFNWGSGCILTWR